MDKSIGANQMPAPRDDYSGWQGQHNSKRIDEIEAALIRCGILKKSYIADNQAIREHRAEIEIERQKQYNRDNGITNWSSMT